MAGGVLLASVIKRPVWRREGRRRGYRSVQLDEFEKVVVAWDDERVALTNRQAMADFKLAMARNNNKAKR